LKIITNILKNVYNFQLAKREKSFYRKNKTVNVYLHRF
jgi:hypothetical protein